MTNAALTFALSPDGKHLAVTSPAFQAIRVYSVLSGAERTWAAPRGTQLLGITWAPDSRTLAFFGFPDLPGYALGGAYLLNTNSSARTLLSASQRVQALARSQCGPAWLLPRQSTIACTISYSVKHVLKTYIADISLQTGKVLRRLPVPGPVLAGQPPQVAWISPTGTRAIVLIAAQAGLRSPESSSAYMVTSRGITKLPGPKWIGSLTAFLPVAW